MHVSNPENEPGLKILRGTGVGRGVAIAPALLLPPSPQTPTDEQRGDETAAVARFEAARAAVSAALDAQSKRAHPAARDVLAATAQMATDSTLRSEVLAHIAAGLGPATAVDVVVQDMTAKFSAAGGYLAERVADLRSVRDRLVSELLDLPAPGIPHAEAPVILIARDLAPADTAEMDFANIAGIITELGGPTSHIAIIADQLGIPCLVGVAGALEVPPETPVGLNSAAGIAYVDPSAATQETLLKQEAALNALESNEQPGTTKDGFEVEIHANAGSVSDAERAAGAKISGIGLFRTEFLFLARTEPPSEAEQAEIYQRVTSNFPSGKVVFRTLDVGFDKPMRFAPLPAEDNPALGVRGYRVYKQYPELLQEQLRALARVQDAAGATVAVMAPMITTVGEAQDFYASAQAAGLQHIGVMIETPAAALAVDEILSEVDFVSLGTNDLAQYTLAMDRLNPQFASALTTWEPAVLQLISKVGRAGARHDKTVGLCGQAASDPLLAPVLIGLGVTSLSMAPSSVAAVTYVLNDHTLAECENIARAALEAPNAARARDAVLNLLSPASRELLAL